MKFKPATVSNCPCVRHSVFRGKNELFGDLGYTEWAIYVLNGHAIMFAPGDGGRAMTLLYSAVEIPDLGKLRRFEIVNQPGLRIMLEAGITNGDVPHYVGLTIKHW